MANREYKNSVFSLLFSDKKNIIELYNAIGGTEYDLDTEVEINTLEKALYFDRYNDLSFLIDGRFVVLIEHQSTINENMPLRALLYVARVYEKIIDSISIYSKTLIKIPTPEFYVLYNGDDKYPATQTLKLSDAFKVPKKFLELEVKVININYEEQPEILEKSHTLRGYSYFVNRVKGFRTQGLSLEEAIPLAIQSCVDEDVLTNFLELHGSEVRNMLYVEFNMEDALKVREAEGKAEGKAESIVEAIKNIVDAFGITVEKAMDTLKIDEEERQKYKDMLDEK